MIGEAVAPLAESNLMERKWPTLWVLALAELLGMSVWLSASAVVPTLKTLWSLDESGQAWLTISVQLGFVVGAFGSAILNLGDRLPTRWLFSIAAWLAALATVLIPIAATGLELALPLRFLTGMFLAGVYPIGMKIMATWTKADRGLGIGLLVGALVIGTAAPHLIKAFGSLENWQGVLYFSAALAATGGLLGVIFVREGPYRSPSPRFNWKQIGEIARNREMVLANLGYLGHMWELYAVWTWIPVFLLTSFQQRGIGVMEAALASFGMIAMGGLGSVLAGKLADRVGRTIITIVSMVVSGVCCLVIGFLFNANPILLIIVCLIWGFAVVADSAQFSACISELSDPLYIGTALTLQTSLGFLLTFVTIRLLPTVVTWVGWEWAFTFLAIGPAVGVLAMVALRRSPQAVKLAGGNR